MNHDESTATEHVRGVASLLFWSGVVTLFTPLAAFAAVLCPIGAIIWLCTPAMQKAETDMYETAEREGDSARSYGALLWTWIVGLAVLNKIKRSRHPLIGAGHFAAGCGVALVWGVVLVVVCLTLYVFLRNGMGV